MIVILFLLKNNLEFLYIIIIHNYKTFVLSLLIITSKLQFFYNHVKLKYTKKKSVI